MDTYLTNEQKELVKKYIDSKPVKAVEIFDYVNKKIKYNPKIHFNEFISVIKGDEEIVRAYFITKLVNELGYDLDKIEAEKKYTAGRPSTNTSKIDFIVHD